MSDLNLVGKAYPLGAKLFTAPPIPLKCAKLYPHYFGGDRIQGVKESPLMEMAQIITITLQRNYPDLTLDDVLEELDVQSVPDAFTRLIEVSGIGGGANSEKP